MPFNPIDGLNLGSLQNQPDKQVGSASQTVDGKDFKQFLLENLDRVNQMQVEADDAVEGVATGQETDLNKVMVAVEKASVAFDTLMAVRNKLVESYQEVLRIQV